MTIRSQHPPVPPGNETGTQLVDINELRPGQAFMNDSTHNVVHPTFHTSGSVAKETASEACQRPSCSSPVCSSHKPGTAVAGLNVFPTLPSLPPATRQTPPRRQQNWARRAVA
jgi:hypothetical protein